MDNQDRQLVHRSGRGQDFDLGRKSEHAAKAVEKILERPKATLSNRI